MESGPDPSGEIRLIAQTIADELTCGTDPRAIAVVGTNHTWRTNLQRALASVGIPAAPLRRQHMKAPKGDLVPTDTCERERVLEQLRRSISQSADSSDSLAVASSNGTTVPNEPAASSQAGDSIAWRQWLSFDDALGRSAAVSELRRIAQSQGLNLAEALAALNADSTGSSAPVPQAPSAKTDFRV